MKKIYILITILIVIFIVSICLISKDYRKSKHSITIAYKEPGFAYNTEIYVWDGLTIDELTNKLNKNLYHELSNTGKYFAQYTAKTGIDPYLAVSIVNLETGCKWNCSKLVKNCYNIGGIKGKRSCNGGSYARYDSLEDGINSYLNIIYKYYWSKGLNTPEKMNSKYAESSSWAKKVNAYYQKIIAS